MDIKTYAAYIFLILLTANVSIFLFLLARKAVYIVIEKRKNFKKKCCEREVVNYMATSQKSNLLDKIILKQSKELLEVVLEYVDVMEEKKKKDLISLLNREQIIKKIQKNLNSKDTLIRTQGAYLAGKLCICEMSDKLLELLNSKNRAEVYTAANSLLKIDGKAYIPMVLNRCIVSNIMEKGNIMHLIDNVQGDIENILLDLMKCEKTYIKSIALETCGKRQYMGIVPWIGKCLMDKDKEIRIAALKGMMYLKNFPYLEYSDVLLKLLEDKEWEVRLFLTKNIKNIHVPESFEILKNLMEDDNILVRNAAAEVLLNKGKDGIIALINSLDCKDKMASQKAQEILQIEILQNNLSHTMDKHNIDLEECFPKKVGIPFLGEIKKI